MPDLSGITTHRQVRDKVFEYEGDLKACYVKVDALNPYLR